MATTETTPRFTLNTLRDAAGWRFFPESDRESTVRLEPAMPRSTPILYQGDSFAVEALIPPFITQQATVVGIDAELAEAGEHRKPIDHSDRKIRATPASASRARG